MDIVLNFKEHLMTGDNPCSPVTAKNYAADVRNFIEWYEQKYSKSFLPDQVSMLTLEEYKTDQAKSLSPATLERHISSLRKLFQYLEQSFQLPNVFKAMQLEKEVLDPWNLNGFKHFLHNYNAASLTIKNYTIDVIQYLKWLSKVSGIENAYEVTDKNIYKYITSESLEEYKFRLHAIAKLSPASINRKLSSLRRYVTWATDEGLINANTLLALQNLNQTPEAILNTSYNLNLPQQSSSLLSLESDVLTDEVPDALSEKESTYSSFPPLRLLQKVRDLGTWGVDLLLAAPISKIIDQLEYTKWTLTGKNIFTVTKLATTIGRDKVRQKITEPLAFLTPNFKKSFYAPLSISTKWLPLHRKLIHHIRHTRPKWYRVYHSYAIVHYAHLGLLILSLSIAGYISYDIFTAKGQNTQSVLASTDYSRMLNYKGKLTDTNGSPITKQTTVKFGLYNDPKEKGSSLLWQEIHQIKPDTNGNFIVSLGQLSPLSQSLFLQNERIYLGIRVSDNPELMPRQQIPTTSYATNADNVQGLRPITDPSSGQRNTLLALDSLGNLTIGGTSSPVFQATGGVFTISGQTLLLGTNPGTNTDVVLAPDGLGKIDLQKPLHNSSDDLTQGNFAGAVTVEDTFAVNANSSTQSALFVSQNGTGPLINASSGGTAKFVLEYAGNVGIGTDTNSIEGKLQVADGNDGYGGTIIAKDGGAILMASNGTAALTIGNNTDGKAEVTLRIFPTGEIDYNNSTTAEPKITLPSNKALFISGGKGIIIAGNIIPATDRMYDLGSENLKWNRIYVNEIITNSTSGTFGFTQLKEGVLSPANISNDFAIGGNSTSSAKFHVTGSGANAGSILTTGTISFSGATPKLIIKTNARFDIETLNTLGGELQPTAKLSLLANGNLGIGTTTPLFKLDLVDSQSNSSVTSITNSNTSANAGVLSLKLGSITPDITNSFINFVNGNGQTIGSITGSSSGGIVYNTTGSDFAEYFKKANPYEVLLPGDLVCLNKTGSVSKCTAVSTNVIGVTSGQAGFVGNSRYQNDPNYILVGLIGQLPVAFSRENGEIEPGDPLAVGTDGKATKAIFPGQIIGKALEGSSASTNEKINVYVALSWHDPSVQLSANGNLPIYNSIESQNLDNENPKLSLNLLLIKGKRVLAESVETTAITATDITTTSLTVAGKSLNEYILEKIAESLRRINAEEINSPLASITSIRTNVISPLSYDSEIALGFRKQVLLIENTKTRKVIAQIDNEGNATFDGTLTAQDASIAGTLRAGRLEADELNLSEKGLAKLREKTSTTSATYVSNITNVYQSTPSATSEDEQTLASTTSPQETNSLGYIEAASLSGTLAYVPELRAKFVTAELGLMSFGPMSTADIAVAGQLSINGSLILADNTINVLGQDLELQPLRQGDLSIMGGRVKIDTEGNLDVTGNASFAKNLKVNDTLFTKLISPLADSDLTIKLNKKKNNEKTAFIIEDASGSAKFSVNELGDLIASGAGKFEEVIAKNINVVRSVQADTSLIETVASSSAGTATINRLQKERTVISPFVTKDSLIYITAISDTNGLTPYIARQVPENIENGIKGSFTIQITKSTTKDIKVNWWIIN